MPSLPSGDDLPSVSWPSVNLAAKAGSGAKTGGKFLFVRLPLALLSALANMVMIAIPVAVVLTLLGPAIGVIAAVGVLGMIDPGTAARAAADVGYSNGV